MAGESTMALTRWNDGLSGSFVMVTYVCSVNRIEFEKWDKSHSFKFRLENLSSHNWVLQRTAK